GIGRFGPYVRMGAIFGSLDPDDDLLSIGLNRAVDVLAKKLANVRALGPHPAGGEAVLVRKGRFGPYVQHGQKVANLPRGKAMDDLTLDEAVALLAEKGRELKPKGRRKAGKQAAGASAAARPNGSKGPASAKKTAARKTSTPAEQAGAKPNMKTRTS